MFFTILIIFVITQRLLELVIAKQNEKWALDQGAIEYGADHYKYIVSLHTLFFLAFIIEYATHPHLHQSWLIFFAIFILAQCFRMWSLRSLGKQWNTKILVIPQSIKVTKGPYRFLSHPNYIVVAVEFMTLPMIFGAYITAITFSILNFLLIYFVRIPAEEFALRIATTPKDK